jgi:hypothetical protein
MEFARVVEIVGDEPAFETGLLLCCASAVCDMLELRSARRTIRDYRKATSDLAGTVDRMLTYVESGTDFTNRFGDINESFYNSLESVLDEMVSLLRTPEGAALHPRFQDRVSRLARAANGIGWGYGEHVAEQVELLEAEVGKQWEHWTDQDAHAGEMQ